MDDARLAELVGLIEFADSVELKLTVPDENRRATVAALGLDPLDALLRQVYFFDTPDLALESAGLVVRARRTQGKPDDSVVKLRPVVPQELPERVRAGKRFGIEVDAMPGGFVCSGSFKGAVKSRPVRDTVLAGGPLRKLFTKGQRAFYAEHAPDGIELDGLAVLGPVHVLKLKSSPEGYDRRLVVELWLYPDGSQILELSTKCAPEEAFDVAARSRAFLAERSVELSGEQRTKTRTALEFFAGELR
ncbi:MAG: adenylate cyclase [Acidobacteria bacterium]|nr:MAG: adenylate cyclase [Acidobacteriota bacterium]